MRGINGVGPTPIFADQGHSVATRFTQSHVLSNVLNRASAVLGAKLHVARRGSQLSFLEKRRISKNKNDNSYTIWGDLQRPTSRHVNRMRCVVAHGKLLYLLYIISTFHMTK